MTVKLAYWDIRGLAQPIRYLLEVGQVPYEERRYICGPAPDFDKSDWLNEKFKLGLDFPNLPYLIDGDKKIVQNLAIMRYLARKCNLDGKSEQEKIQCDVIEQHRADLRTVWGRLCYNPQFEKEKAGYLEQLPKWLKAFSDSLGSRPYFAGDRLTYVDLLVYEIMKQNVVFSKVSFADVPNLVQFIERIEAIPQMVKYMKSGKFIKWPFNNHMASYGAIGQGSPF